MCGAELLLYFNPEVAPFYSYVELYYIYLFWDSESLFWICDV